MLNQGSFYGLWRGDNHPLRGFLVGAREKFDTFFQNFSRFFSNSFKICSNFFKIFFQFNQDFFQVNQDFFQLNQDLYGRNMSSKDSYTCLISNNASLKPMHVCMYIHVCIILSISIRWF